MTVTKFFRKVLELTEYWFKGEKKNQEEWRNTLKAMQFQQKKS